MMIKEMEKRRKEAVHTSLEKCNMCVEYFQNTHQSSRCLCDMSNKTMVLFKCFEVMWIPARVPDAAFLQEASPRVIKDHHPQSLHQGTYR